MSRCVAAVRIKSVPKLKRERGEVSSPRTFLPFRVESFGCGHPRFTQADRTLRPLARRRARTLRPLEVAILFRKPWTLER